MRKRLKITESPEGFRYQAEVLPSDQEHALAEQIQKLPLKEFEFHGYTGQRRGNSFGWHYSFEQERLQQAEDIPPFLLAARAYAASFASMAPEDLPHVLVTEYSPGTMIGWHRDKGVFDNVVGILLFPLQLPAPAQDGLRLGALFANR